MNGSARETVSATRLWKATAAAVVVAGILLVTVVLPAEYGIDPTSVGRLLGLGRLDAEPATSAPAVAGEPAAPMDELEALMAGNTVAAAPEAHRSEARPFTSEETAIRLAPLEEVEVKARMSPGDTMLYAWQTSAPIYVDTHGEPFDYPDSPAVRYAEEDGVSSANGRITAPIAGLHGWYWLNSSEDPITITLKTSGYYEDLDEIYRNQQ